jgi:hypothetical protein
MSGKNTALISIVSTIISSIVTYKVVSKVEINRKKERVLRELEDTLGLNHPIPQIEKETVMAN